MSMKYWGIVDKPLDFGGYPGTRFFSDPQVLLDPHFGAS